jgi:hypothetical protein
MKPREAVGARVKNGIDDHGEPTLERERPSGDLVFALVGRRRTRKLVEIDHRRRDTGRSVSKERLEQVVLFVFRLARAVDDVDDALDVTLREKLGVGEILGTQHVAVVRETRIERPIAISEAPRIEQEDRNAVVGIVARAASVSSAGTTSDSAGQLLNVRTTAIGWADAWLIAWPNATEAAPRKSTTQRVPASVQTRAAFEPARTARSTTARSRTSGNGLSRHPSSALTSVSFSNHCHGTLSGSCHQLATSADDTSTFTCPEVAWCDTPSAVAGPIGGTGYAACVCGMHADDRKTTGTVCHRSFVMRRPRRRPAARARRAMRGFPA